MERSECCTEEGCGDVGQLPVAGSAQELIWMQGILGKKGRGGMNIAQADLHRGLPKTSNCRLGEMLPNEA